MEGVRGDDHLEGVEGEVQVHELEEGVEGVLIHDLLEGVVEEVHPS